MSNTNRFQQWRGKREVGETYPIESKRPRTLENPTMFTGNVASAARSECNKPRKLFARITQAVEPPLTCIACVGYTQ
jgi:hypothetical protein